MVAFVSVVKKTKQGAFYIGIPQEIMKKMNLKLFMACKIKTEKNRIKIFDFEKTVKIKIDINKKIER